MGSLDTYKQDLDKAVGSVLWFTACMLGIGVLVLLSGNWHWALVPIFLGLPASAVLVIQGRREAYMAKCVVAMVLAFASCVVAALIFEVS